MSKAPLALGAAILFWGWQCNVLEYSVVMALLVELPFLFTARWDFSDRDFERISDLCALLLAGLTVYQFDAHSFHAIFPILKSVPFVLSLIHISEPTRPC